MSQIHEPTRCSVCYEPMGTRANGQIRRHDENGRHCPGTGQYPAVPKVFTAKEAAAELRCETARKVTEVATRHQIGYNLKGRAGYRFTSLDIERLRKAMAPPAPIEQRRTA